jgi:hypothetical protein
MQIGDNVAAAECLARGAAIFNPTDHTVLDSNWWSYQGELAIRLNDAESAEIAVERCVKSASLGQSPRGSIRAFALEAQLLCIKGQSMSAASLESFLRCFEVTKLSSLQDYSVESLLRVLDVVGRREDAIQLAADYVSGFRRDLSPLSVPLSEVIHSLKEN